MVKLPSRAGTYCLILRMYNAAGLTIGKLGQFNFPAGWYAYTGSARGPGGLRGRLQHHLRPVGNAHWHIDYLRSLATVRLVWYQAGARASEHAWAEALAKMPGANIPAMRFGASDCRCASHLVHFSQPPDRARFQQLSGSAMESWGDDES